MSIPIILLIYLLIGFVINLIVDIIRERGEILDGLYPLMLVGWPVFLALGLLYLVLFVALPKASRYLANLIRR